MRRRQTQTPTTRARVAGKDLDSAKTSLLAWQVAEQGRAQHPGFRPRGFRSRGLSASRMWGQMHVALNLKSTLTLIAQANQTFSVFRCYELKCTSTTVLGECTLSPSSARGRALAGLPAEVDFDSSLYDRAAPAAGQSLSEGYNTYLAPEGYQ